MDQEHAAKHLFPIPATCRNIIKQVAKRGKCDDRWRQDPLLCDQSARLFNPNEPERLVFDLLGANGISISDFPKQRALFASVKIDANWGQ